MEPSAGNVTEQPPRIGRRGSLDNPEVYENVPGHIIPILEQEFDDFDTEAGRFLDGEIDETEFIGFRLKQGVYGQRQPDVQMIRVKLPFGGVTPDQLDAFADVVEKYVPLNKGHITTRQNIQMHHVPLPDAAKLIRELSDAGLSSREGCGNTVRNVTGDPWAGICEGELFDPTPYAGAYVRYFVRHPTTQLMPRKGQDGVYRHRRGPRDHRHPRRRLHPADPRRRPRLRDARRRRHLGDAARRPHAVDFVAADDGEYLKSTEACCGSSTARTGCASTAPRARIKVLVDKIGIEALREQVEEELEGDWVAERDFTSTELLFVDDEEATPRRPPRLRSPNGDAASSSASRGQRRAPAPGRASAPCRSQVTRGDLTPEQLPRLADIARVLRRLLAHDGAPEPRPALGARRVGLRRLAPAGRPRSWATPAPTDQRRRLVPGTDSASSASRARWA
jgi:hypothetical protein